MPDVEPEGTSQKDARLMISYSRKDKVFVKQLHDALLAQGFASEDIWVTGRVSRQRGWMAEITKGIQSANAFIFVVSPDSVASEVCKKEIEVAAESNKRFIPILYRELAKGADLHPKISSHNSVFMRDEQELEKTLPALVEAINTTWIGLPSISVYRIVPLNGITKDATIAIWYEEMIYRKLKLSSVKVPRERNRLRPRCTLNLCKPPAIMPRR